MNARFWAWHNDGWVKLTLKPYQTLRHYHWHRTDEGWSSEFIEWQYTTNDNGDALIERRTENCGRDCDGRLDRYYNDWCYVSDLQGDDRSHEDWHRHGIDPRYTPAWQPGRCSQRDYEAEKAGY